MAKTDYIIMSNAQFRKVEAETPEKAMKEYIEKFPGATNILLAPRKACYLDGKKIKP